MCHTSCIQFAKSHLLEEDVRRKEVIEVGSRNVNGSVREVVEPLKPFSYLGVDIETGSGVDDICDVNDLVSRFGKERFDVVISTELFEHVRHWRRAVSSLKNILKPNGILLLTTRSRGFRYHGYPFDFWRYERADMEVIFSDLSVEAIEEDPVSPGVFVKARKPISFVENDLTFHELYSIIRDRRCRDIRDSDISIWRLTRRPRLSYRRRAARRHPSFHSKINKP